MADTSPNSWKLLYEAGRQALQAKKLQEAEQSFSAALQLAEDFPPGDPRLAATLNALARIYSLQRRYLAAAALLNRLLEVTERTLGSSHVQVAGVLTNLAEMYTHLGASREELELRERVLSIRGGDPDADAGLLERLRERVAELRAALEAQEAPEAEEEYEPLPTVRTAEYSAPMGVIADERAGETARAVESEPAAADARDTYRMSPATSSLSIAPWPGAAVTGTTSTDVRPAVRMRAAEPVAAISTTSSLPPVERVTPALVPIAAIGGGMDHGFADMGRDELRMPFARRMSSRSGIYSIAAGVLLVAGLLATRNYMNAAADEGRVSAGTVNLANVVAPPAAAPAAQSVPDLEPRTVERLVAERRAETSRSEAGVESPRGAVRERSQTAALPPRLPSGAAIERALKGVDGAVKVIDQRTRAAADSATQIRVPDPTFKNGRMATP